MKPVQYTTVFPGYVRQLFHKKDLIEYNAEYLKPYESYNSLDSNELNRIRYSIIKDLPKNILDVGYGSGSFLKYLRELDPNSDDNLYGYDVIKSNINGVRILDNENDMFKHNFDVVTMFDSLEHIPVTDVRTYLNKFNTQYFVISVPWFHYHKGNERFKNWRHTRPNEHLHYFDSFGLVEVLNQVGYNVIHISNIEDTIRKAQVGYENLPNILTVVAKKSVITSNWSM